MSRGEFHHAAKRQEGGVCEQEAGRRGAQQLPSHWPQSWGGGLLHLKSCVGPLVKKHVQVKASQLLKNPT